MEFSEDELGVRLVVKEPLTVRDRLQYKGALGTSFFDDQLYIRMWNGAKKIIEEWECELVPLDIDIDQCTDPKAAEIIEWAGLVVWSYVRSLSETPKNS